LFFSVLLPSSIRHLSCDDCLEDKRKVYQYQCKLWPGKTRLRNSKIVCWAEHKILFTYSLTFFVLLSETCTCGKLVVNRSGCCRIEFGFRQSDGRRHADMYLRQLTQLSHLTTRLHYYRQRVTLLRMVDGQTVTLMMLVVIIFSHQRTSQLYVS